MTGIKPWIRALEYTQRAADKTLPGMIDELADTYGERPALLTNSHILSYKALAGRANQYARWAMGQGFRSGDVVCLLMTNQPDHAAIWLGLTRIGCTVALLNINLRGDALLHCIKVAGSDTVIIAGLTQEVVPPVKRLYVWTALPRADDWSGFSSGPIADVPPPRPDDRGLLIYTSGTTGLPKATNITHRRIIEWSFWFAGMMNTQPDDRLYNCLPMYHSTGGVVAIGSMLVNGGSVFIRDRFSASRFWDDVCDEGCTIFQYIGELCRYLTQSKPHPREGEHRLRLACGNGLQGDVWLKFQDRFRIPQILEFYAATEGNLSLYNCEGRPGAIGRIPRFLARSFSVSIIKCDPVTGVPLRNGDGFCIQCATGETGEAISQIGNRQFDGYTDPDASGRKILQDVFTEDDRWFRSGDLMRRDAGGYYYFVDRLGDTFRWKGENVSTTEVAAVLRGCAGVVDAVVYGVSVQGSEGRAGMAAISTNHGFNVAALSAHLKEHLPDYAHPVFVRFCASLDVTGTFKLTKTDFLREGYTNVSDPVWVRDHKTGEYHELMEMTP
jgi:fatty-acyl-CoA synthase